VLYEFIGAVWGVRGNCFGGGVGKGAGGAMFSSVRGDGQSIADWYGGVMANSGRTVQCSG